jgi:hypothetical protein
VTYLATVLADAPVHYWRFADPGGWLAHDIGSSPVHLAGGVSAQIGYSGIASDGGAAAVLNGSGFQTLDAVSQARPLSIEFWLWRLYKSSALESLFYWDGVAANSVAIDLDAGGQANVFGTGLTTFFTPAVIPTQGWHHLVVTLAAGASTLYLDGANVAANATQVTSPVNRRIGIGMQPGFTQPANAFFAEVAVYGAALAAARVAAHFAAQEVTQAPVYRLGGPPGGGGGLPAPGDLFDAILSSVRKTY